MTYWSHRCEPTEAVVANATRTEAPDEVLVMAYENNTTEEE